MNGYVNIDNKYSDAIMKFADSEVTEITVTGIYKYLEFIFSINKLFVSSGSIIDRSGGITEYNCVFNIIKNSDDDFFISILFGNVIIGISVAPDDKITKIGG